MPWKESISWVPDPSCTKLYHPAVLWVLCSNPGRTGRSWPHSWNLRTCPPDTNQADNIALLLHSSEGWNMAVPGGVRLEVAGNNTQILVIMCLRHLQYQ